MMDKRNLLQEKGDWLAEIGNITMAKAARITPPTWNRQGLHDLAETAVAMFTAKTGIALPYNLATHGPYVGYYWHRKRIIRDETGNQVVEETARFTGWLKAASEIPGLARWIGQVTSTRGMNSPYTMVDLWSVARNNPSPGYFYRQLCKIRWRANQILHPFGLSMSRQSMAMVAGKGLKRAGKTAYKAAADTIQFYLGRKFDIWDFGQGMRSRQVLESARGLREFSCQPKYIQGWIADAINKGRFSNFLQALKHITLLEDTTDGVALWLDHTQREVVHGAEVVPGWDNSGQSQYLILYKNRSYHAQRWNGSSARSAVREALQAWHRQDELMQKETEFLSKLQPSDRTILVRPEDSWASGNCQPGTSAWMRQHGLAGRRYAPVSVLFPHIGDPRVWRVLQTVANKMAA